MLVIITLHEYLILQSEFLNTLWNSQRFLKGNFTPFECNYI